MDDFSDRLYSWPVPAGPIAPRKRIIMSGQAARTVPPDVKLIPPAFVPYGGVASDLDLGKGGYGKAQMDVSRRHTEVQRLRCRNLLVKLKTIQLEEMEEYGENQIEAAVTTIGKSKGISFPEVKLHSFFQKKTYMANSLDVEEQDVGGEGCNIHNTVLYERKKGLQNVRDVTAMMKKNMKETLLSTVMLGIDTDETESDSDYENEFESKASVKGHRDKEDFQGYLPVEENPITKWARQRHEILTRWKYIADGLRSVRYRMHEQEAFLNYLRENKPEFKFDENPNPGHRHVNPNAEATLKDATINIYHEAKKSSLVTGGTTKRHTIHTTTDGQPIFYGYKQKPNGRYREQAPHPSSQRGPILQPREIKQEPGVVTEATNKGHVGGGLEGLKLRILDPQDPTTIARRCLPVKPYRPRRIFQLGGVYNMIGEPIRQITSICSCYGRTELCAICRGRTDKMKRVKTSTMAHNQVSALLDHTYHKALSTCDEKPLRKLVESSLKAEDWNKCGTVKQQLNATFDSSGDEDSLSELEILKPVFLHTKPVRVIDTIAPPSKVKKIKKEKRPRPEKKVVRETPTKKSRKRRRSDDEDEEEEEEEEVAWAPAKRTKSAGQDYTKRRRVDEKYDIDHIVIPYSIAAATRVEKIEYKEIVIPSWRVNPMEPLAQLPPVPGTSRMKRPRRRSSTNGYGTDDEDVSLEAIVARHQRSELEEKERFLKAVNRMKRKARRSECKVEPSEGITSVSPILEITDNVPLIPPLVDEAVLLSTSNQISREDASLAVTALKISNASLSRRRTVSASKIEDEETEDPGYVPFEPRKFPLPENEYEDMVKEMEAAYEESERISVQSFESPMKLKPETGYDDGSDQEDKLHDPDWNDNPPIEQPVPLPSSGTKLNRRSKRGSLTPISEI